MQYDGKLQSIFIRMRYSFLRMSKTKILKPPFDYNGKLRLRSQYIGCVPNFTFCQWWKSIVHAT